MAGIDKSPKLIFNEFQKSITEVPLDVFYQNITCEQYNVSGFQFNIKQPGNRALLDPDIWIKYSIVVRETAVNSIRNLFENPGVNGTPLSDAKFAVRSGFALWRCMQNFSLQINNTTVTVQPYKWVDVVNRLYVSNEQSRHEFSMSGGEFDSGNHSNKTQNVPFYHQVATDARATNQPVGANQVTVNVALAYPNGFMSNYPNPAAAPATNFTTLNHLRPTWPLMYDNYNPGFGYRTDKLTRKLRDCCGNASQLGTTGLQWIPRLAGSGVGQLVDGFQNMNYYKLDFYERLPLPLFKMYSNDSVYGVIPNVNQLQIQANFLALFTQNFFRGYDVFAAAVPAIQVEWTKIQDSYCVLYLRWFTPPQTMVIPRELSIPYPKIVAWSKVISPTAFAANDNNLYNNGYVEEYNITLESIPDLLLIYLKQRNLNYDLSYPDDYLLEIVTLYINIDSSSGKLNQITTIDLYNKWKKILKHGDSNIIEFDEWRKYCCVACLQPDDYGVRFGPGYSNQTVLGVKIDYNNWWNIPTLGYGSQEIFPTGNFDLYVTAIYNRNRLVIRSDGSASQDMLKVAADFNMTPVTAMEEMDSRGRLNL